MGEGFFQFSLLNYIYIYILYHVCQKILLKKQMMCIDVIGFSFHGINYTNCCF